MTSTDRAFIAAIQQASAGLHVKPTAAPSTKNEPSVASPHFGAGAAAPEPRAAKAPLSEHLARRRQAAEQARPAEAPKANPTTSAPPLRPGVEVDSLRWPSLAEALETGARTELLALLSRATQAGRSAEAPAIVFVSSVAGVGATTALLATARLIASVGGKVAILDLTSANGAAAQLGVRRVAHLDSRLDVTAIDDLLVTSRDAGTSVLAADGDRLAEAALQRLTATHDLVLVDAGEATTTTPLLAAPSMSSAAVVLVDAADAKARVAALAKLNHDGVTITGIVEAQVDAA